MAQIGRLLFGRKPKLREFTPYSEQQQQAQQQLLGGLTGEGQMPGGALGSLLQQLQALMSGQQGAYEEFEAPLMRQFQEDIIPGIAERFAGMGTGGSLRSSGFQQAGARAGVDLTERLAQLRGQLRQGAMGQLSSLYGAAMQPQKEFYQTQGVPGLAIQLAEIGGNIAAKKAFGG